MKKVLCLFLVGAMCVSAVACSNGESQKTSKTSEEPTTKSEFDIELESFKESVAEYVEKQKELDKQLEESLKRENQELIESKPNEIADEYDYGNIGFEMTYGMTEWLQIAGYRFSDENSYVYTDSRNDVCSFSYNFLKTYEDYDDYIENNVGEAANCTIQNNDSLTIASGVYGGTSLVIKERKLTRNIPIIVVQSTKTYWGHTIFNNDALEAWFIPMDFIDWEKSPENNVLINDEGDKGDKFYIKSEYLD